MTVGEYLEQTAGVERKPDTYVRTNIMLSERLIEEARELTGLQTKKDIVEEALKLYVQIQRQAEIRKLRGIGWEGDLEEMRRSREFVLDEG
ncbi:MAG: type II toxin-antitoxin system VapB family antitoxin [Armatimonadota bacterium]